MNAPAYCQQTNGTSTSPQASCPSSKPLLCSTRKTCVPKLTQPSPSACTFKMPLPKAEAGNFSPKPFQGVYGTYLPFYPLGDDYTPDEINQEDIAFVLWTLKSQFSIFDKEYTLFSPYDKDLLALSQSAYELMDARFEEAPISEGESSFLWVMGLDLLDMPITPLPEVTPETKLSKDAARCLEYSQGKPLLYFTDYKELCTFFVDVLGWENKRSALLPDLEYQKEFVIYANAKGMLVAHNVAAYFCEEHNPMYDAKRAAAEGYKMFCQPGECPFDLLKYGMTKGILPDVELPFLKGKETLHQYWDFIARYYLCEYYEGE